MGAADAAVEDGGDDDQSALEEVLPRLAETQEGGGVEQLHDEAGAEEGADEGASTTQQAGGIRLSANS